MGLEQYLENAIGIVISKCRMIGKTYGQIMTNAG